jgi:hypothetical protein
MGDRTAAKGSTRVLCGAYIEEAPSFVRGSAAEMGGDCEFEPVIKGAVVEEVSGIGRDSRSLTSVEALLVLDEGTDSGWKFR